MRARMCAATLFGLLLLGVGCDRSSQDKPGGEGTQPKSTTPNEPPEAVPAPLVEALAQAEPAAKPEPAPAACPAVADWFAQPLSTPFPTSFPDDPNNCDFHQWSWQTFLALMSPEAAATGPRVFEHLHAPDALFCPGGPDSAECKAHADPAHPTYLINQAGPGDNVLVDQRGQMVYYSLFLNDVYRKFIVDNGFYELSKLQSPEAAKATFPVGSLELKVSWRVAKDLDAGTVYIDEPGDFYSIDAVVPAYKVANDIVVVDGDKTRKVRLAMVGMHVTGVVNNHPEFIWATFEHLSNAPDNAPGKVATTGPFEPPATPWGLYKPDTNSDLCNIFDDTAPQAPACITRLDPWGGGSEDNTSNIKALTQAVWRQLPSERALLKNYFQVGAVWTNGDIPRDDAAFGPEAPKGRIIGSVHASDPKAGLANTTMESFTQQQNCFFCHNGGSHSVAVLQPDGTQRTTTIAPKPINLSHFVVNYQAAQQLTSPAR